MKFRKQLQESDISYIEDILNSSNFFYDHEVKVALELAQENLTDGEEKSGYIFIICEVEEKPVAFACYGKTPCTEDSFDLYWIAAHQNQMGKGIGKILMKMIDEDIKNLGGKSIWIETSSRPLYEPTRQFYIKTQCELVAELPDFYGKNDNKLVFLRKV
ncbi:MAG: GNAT family N-acetyltransferase [Bacteroidales bacterium]|nr:GNAT family N-acetyltransferase [Bacteroidales bacterium]MCF8391880.1 GNAT family N-acetyltransferase [Bacteroidales bacterium]